MGEISKKWMDPGSHFSDVIPRAPLFVLGGDWRGGNLPASPVTKKGGNGPCIRERDESQELTPSEL